MSHGQDETNSSRSVFGRRQGLCTQAACQANRPYSTRIIAAGCSRDSVEIPRAGTTIQGWCKAL